MNISNIDADIDFLAGSTSASYSPTSKRRNMNIAYHNVATMIWESDGTWNYDDSNNSTTPIAYRTVANASATYVIPTTAIRIKDVEIKDVASVWHRLRAITLDDMVGQSPEAYMTGAGLPTEYWLEGNEIRLFPPPGTGFVTMSSGMAVRLTRTVNEFAVTAATTTPGFPAPFHRILSYSAAIDFVQDQQTRQFLLLQKDRLTKGLINFYAKRGDEYKTRVVPATQRRQRQYL